MTRPDQWLPITLTPDELRRANLMAHWRNDPKVARGIKSKHYAPNTQSTFQLHLWGVCGEMAVAKYLCVPVDTRVLLGGDGCVGDLNFNGQSVQVKCRRKAGWDFAMGSDSPEELRADIGVLVYCTPKKNTFLIAGFCTREEFLSAYSLADYGHGARAVMKVTQLRYIGELIRERTYA